MACATQRNISVHRMVSFPDKVLVRHLDATNTNTNVVAVAWTKTTENIRPEDERTLQRGVSEAFCSARSSNSMSVIVVIVIVVISLTHSLTRSKLL